MNPTLGIWLNGDFRSATGKSALPLTSDVAVHLAN